MVVPSTFASAAPGTNSLFVEYLVLPGIMIKHLCIVYHFPVPKIYLKCGGMLKLRGWAPGD